jgi:hypothetical protein
MQKLILSCLSVNLIMGSYLSGEEFTIQQIEDSETEMRDASGK